MTPDSRETIIAEFTVHQEKLGVTGMAAAEARRFLEGLVIDLDVTTLGPNNGPYRITKAEPSGDGLWKCTATKVDVAAYDWS